jgi:hypothetical protein
MLIKDLINGEFRKTEKQKNVGSKFNGRKPTNKKMWGTNLMR